MPTAPPGARPTLPSPSPPSWRRSAGPPRPLPTSTTARPPLAMPRPTRTRTVRRCQLTGLPVVDPVVGRPRDYANERARKIENLLSWLDGELAEPDFKVSPAAAKALRSRLWSMANGLNDRVMPQADVDAAFEQARADLVVSLN